MKRPIHLLWLLLIFIATNVRAQIQETPNNNHCKVSASNLPVDSTFIRESEELEIFTKNFSPKDLNGGNCYVIPVVFHVYGTSQGGLAVNDALIIDAMDKLNKDFHGLNADYATVHNSFLSIRSNMPDVIFALAQKDPSGSSTTGIVYHPVTAGYANGSGYDAAIAADAWDNYKYMNIYIMNDLFNDGITNNSGYAYYPSSFMSNNNTARIVYNGAYLGTNTSTEFASTLTHEYGHWLNLIHTFNGGCVAPNDQVSDTPPCDYLGSSYLCHASSSANSPLNCNSDLINAENYMDYSGASGCYKMFTQGQVARMYAALQHPSREPLWQTSNLVATGLDHLCNSSGINSYYTSGFNIYPNPSKGIFTIRSMENKEAICMITISNMVGKEIYRYTPQNTSEVQFNIDITDNAAGIYFLQIKLKSYTQTYQLVIH